MLYNVYQIACGEPGRDYREIFFDNDVMILGPAHKEVFQNNPFLSKSNSQEYQVNSFCFDPEPGDFIILRFAHEIIGLGKIPKGEDNQYTFQKNFGNVYGWSLYHCRRVMWYKNIDLNPIRNVYSDVKQMPSFSDDDNEKIKGFINNIYHNPYNRRLYKMKYIDISIYSEEEFGIELFKAGISNNNIFLINQAIKQANRLLNWYWSGEEVSGRYPTESDKPVGYIDLSSLQKKYIIPKNTHLIDSLVMLLPTSF